MKVPLFTTLRQPDTIGTMGCQCRFLYGMVITRDTLCRNAVQRRQFVSHTKRYVTFEFKYIIYFTKLLIEFII